MVYILGSGPLFVPVMAPAKSRASRVHSPAPLNARYLAAVYIEPSMVITGGAREAYKMG